jgi:hypothetical protein
MRTKIKNEYINISKEEIKKILLGELSLSVLAENLLKMNPNLDFCTEQEREQIKTLYPEIFL